MVNRIDEDEMPEQPTPQGTRVLSDEEFFDMLARGMERRAAQKKGTTARKPSPPGIAFVSWVIAWLCGAGIVLGLAAGVLWLGRLVAGLLGI